MAKMTSKLDHAAEKSAQLKEEVAELQNQLPALAKQQTEPCAGRRIARRDAGLHRDVSPPPSPRWVGQALCV